MSGTCFRVNSPSVIYENFDDELVAINLDTGVYHSLTGAAADAFQLLVNEATQHELAEVLATRYTASVETIDGALDGFLKQLQKEELICLVETRTQRPPLQLNGDRTGLPFTPPTLEAYRDLQSLFLLDPVHEVGEEGWPNPGPSAAEA
jgi:hypothetical protein